MGCPSPSFSLLYYPAISATHSLGCLGPLSVSFAPSLLPLSIPSSTAQLSLLVMFSPLFSLPDASGCTVPHICNKNLPLSHTLGWSCLHFIHFAIIIRCHFGIWLVEETLLRYVCSRKQGSNQDGRGRWRNPGAVPGTYFLVCRPTGSSSQLCRLCCSKGTLHRVGGCVRAVGEPSFEAFVSLVEARMEGSKKGSSQGYYEQMTIPQAGAEKEEPQ